MEVSAHLQAIIRALPDSPGIYQFFDKNEKIIYVGKAKNLKNRVSSYFNKIQYENGKTRVLVKNITDIKVLIVSSELDALLLENNLIKKYQPRFNVMLKDDKTYPWICIKNEPFPRIFPTRKMIRDGSEYFGPYASVKMMRTVLDLAKQLYPVRTCRLQLTPENIRKNKFKVCLEYHIGNCKGPCEGLQSEEEYMEMIAQIRHIVRGNISEVTRALKERMQQHATAYEFEQAQGIKLKLEQIDKFRSKSVIVNADIDNVDVFSIETDDSHAYINYLKVNNGSIVQGYTLELKKKMDESPEELLTMSIIELRQRFHSTSQEILVPFLPDITWPGVRFTVPQRGDKKMLLDLSVRNVKFYVQDKIRQLSVKDPEKHTKRILEQMKKDLRMQEIPQHIECFDNSNFQGDYAVSAMVCFKDAKPSKKDYRHFNIRTVTGPDDFASMREVLSRRYGRMLAENQPVPQLIVIDGGKGQLGIAVEVLKELGLHGKVTVIGIAKKLEEIFYPGDSLPLYIDKRSETLKVLQHIRNEAHRFGITHYRKRHIKGLVKTELQDIPGIGEATANDLLTHFKSVKKLREASPEEIAAVVGKSKAQKIMDYFTSLR